MNSQNSLFEQNKTIRFLSDFLKSHFWHFLLVLLFSHLPILLYLFGFFEFIIAPFKLRVIHFFSFFPIQIDYGNHSIWILIFYVTSLLLYAYSRSVFTSFFFAKTQKLKLNDWLEAVIKSFPRFAATYTLYAFIIIVLFALNIWLVRELEVHPYWADAYFLLTIAILIYLNVRLSLIDFVIFNDKFAVWKAMGRSWYLTRGYFVQIFLWKAIIATICFFILFSSIFIWEMLSGRNISSELGTTYIGLGSVEMIKDISRYLTITFFVFYICYSILMETAMFAQYSQLSQKKFGLSLFAEKASQLGKKEQENEEENF